MAGQCSGRSTSLQNKEDRRVQAKAGINCLTRDFSRTNMRNTTLMSARLPAPKETGGQPLLLAGFPLKKCAEE